MRRGVASIQGRWPCADLRPALPTDFPLSRLECKIESGCQLNIFIGERAITVGDGEVIFVVSGSVAGNLPEGAFRLCTFDGNDAGPLPDD